MNTVNSRIDTIVSELKLSNQEFGDSIGVTEATIRNLRRKGNVSDIYVEVISLKYNYSKNWIKSGEGEKKLNSQKEVLLSIPKLSEECIKNWDKLLEDPLFKAKLENEATKVAYEITPRIIEQFRQEWEKSNVR
ncbi:hypothetical protein U6A24_12740 [Aquimarina gracilis]|uniref:XRE family transcriptional regulator n=1 Tax=Aquimarina gracilis TaxID=874422 RepID=A0ABU5ZWU4_9FLAO|nr:hypothetical protein [Aquimarina gracilis]MEB3346337.1 hypothetical protein [Aquimarina gracilis]